MESTSLPSLNETWTLDYDNEISAIMLSAAWLLGCTANAYVIHCGLAAWRTSKKPLTMFIISLACIDFMTCFLVLPYDIVNKVIPFPRYARGTVIGQVFCEIRIVAIISSFLYNSGNWHHLLISYNRYSVTSLNIFQYTRRFTFAKCKRFIQLLYGVPFAMAGLQLTWAIRRLHSESGAAFQCMVATNGNFKLAGSILALSSLFFTELLPAMLSIALLAAVIYKLERGTAHNISDRTWTRYALSLLILKWLLEIPFLVATTCNLNIFGLDISDNIIIILREVKTLSSIITPCIYGLRLSEFRQPTSNSLSHVNRNIPLPQTDSFNQRF